MSDKEFKLGMFMVGCFTLMISISVYFYYLRGVETAKISTQAKTEQVKDRTSRFPWVRR